MKNILIVFFGSIIGIYAITGTLVHFWTAFIALTESGIFAAFISFAFPFLSEIYWMAQMYGENTFYFWAALIHLILALPIGMATQGA